MIPILHVALLVVQVASNAELGYRFTVPDGFTALAAAANQPDMVGCWTEAVPTTPGGGLLLCVQRMHGTIGRDGIKPEELPPSMHLTHYKWKGFDLDGLQIDTIGADGPVRILSAQVPLRHEAIQLIVTGPPDQAARVDGIMTATLGSLEGETNWLTSGERSGRLGVVAGWVIGFAVALVLVRWWRARRRSTAT